MCVFSPRISRLKLCLTNGLTSGWDFNYLFFFPSSPLIEFSSPFSVALCMMMIWRSCAQNISFTSNEKWKSTELIKLFNWQSSRCCESGGDFSMWIRLNFFISFNFYIQIARHEQLRAYEASRKIKKTQQHIKLKLNFTPRRIDLIKSHLIGNANMFRLLSPHSSSHTKSLNQNYTEQQRLWAPFSQRLASAFGLSMSKLFFCYTYLAFILV